MGIKVGEYEFIWFCLDVWSEWDVVLDFWIWRSVFFCFGYVLIYLWCGCDELFIWFLNLFFNILYFWVLYGWYKFRCIWFNYWYGILWRKWILENYKYISYSCYISNGFLDFEIYSKYGEMDDLLYSWFFFFNFINEYYLIVCVYNFGWIWGMYRLFYYCVIGDCGFFYYNIR